LQEVRSNMNWFVFYFVFLSLIEQQFNTHYRHSFFFFFAFSYMLLFCKFKNEKFFFNLD
jgi:hypothetical protein